MGTIYMGDHSTAFPDLGTPLRLFRINTKARHWWAGRRMRVRSAFPGVLSNPTQLALA